MIISCALACAAASPGRARAEDPPKALLEGVRHYGAARFKRSLRALRKAARATRDPRTQAKIQLYMGCNYIELKEESAAREALHRALTLTPALKLDPESFKERVRRRLEQIKRHLFGVASFSSKRPGVLIRIDGKVWGVTPQKELAVPAGLHWLELRHQGRALLRRRWSVSPGQEDLFTVSARGVGAAAKAAVEVRRQLVKPGRACSRDGWCWENPLPRGRSRFYGIWGSGPDDVFLVGSGNSVLHYDGQSWLSMPLPAGSVWRWRGIWGNGPTNVYAVGAYGSVARYDGRRWTTAVPRRSITDSHLHSVWGSSPSNVITVGYKGAILQYDGSRWHDRSPGWPHDLASVWGSGPSNVFAVGGIILRYDGVQWVRMKRPPKANQRFRDVWGTGPTNVFLTGLSRKGTISRFDGKAWRAMAHPLKGYGGRGLWMVVTGVWGTGPLSVWATVDSGQILRFDGKQWRGEAILPVGRLEDIWGSGPSDIYVVGAGTSVVRYDGKRWVSMSRSFCKKNLVRVSVYGPDRVQALSQRGRLYRYDGKAWSAGHSVPIGHATSYLFKVKLPKGTFNRQGRPYVNLTIKAFKHRSFSIWNPAGRTWKNVKLPPDAEHPLHDVWRSPGGQLFAVGQSGAAFRHDGKAWRATKTGTKARLLGVWGSSERNVLAVGATGAVLRFDGRRWRRMRLPAARVHKLSLRELILNDVWGSGPKNVFAVGVAGVVVRYDGRRWRLMPTPTGRSLNAVWGSGPKDVYAVGNKGVVLHFNGKAWRAVDSGTAYDLFSVAGSSPENVYVVGERGALLHLGPR